MTNFSRLVLAASIFCLALVLLLVVQTDRAAAEGFSIATPPPASTYEFQIVDLTLAPGGSENQIGVDLLNRYGSRGYRLVATIGALGILERQIAQ